MVSHSAVSMKVLVFSEEYPPERGGVAISTHRIVSGLHEAGVELAVVCYDSSSSPADVPHVCSTAESEGLWLHRVGPYFRHRAEEVSEEEKAAMRRNAFLQVRRLAEQFRPDLIHSIYLLDGGFLASLVARQLGIPHLTSARGNDLSRSLFHAGRFALLRHTVESADGITFVSEYLATLARTAFRLPRIAEIVPNGVVIAEAPHDPAALRTVTRTRFAIPSDHPVIGFVGWARPKKGLEDLLDALAAVQTTSPRLLIIGDFIDARDKAAFAERAQRLGLADRVAVTGPLDHCRVRDLLPALDAMVIPSWDDGMPNALLEAMERGLPVFGSDVFADVLEHGRNGLIFERHDVARLTLLLDQFLQRPDVLTAVGLAARQTAIERFDYRYERDAYLRVYESLLSGRVRRGREETHCAPC